jgi:dephospho-CoA kinase
MVYLISYGKLIMKLIIGVTGGISSGKTTVANLFSDHFNIDIVDADIVAREVVKKGTPGLAAIECYFGQEILTPDGQLNRPLLREKIFNDQQDKLWLNQLLHPMIQQRMQEQVNKAKSEYVLLVVPLLIENSLQALTQRILVVDVDEETQITRTMLRDGVSEQQAKKILNAQATRAERLRWADDVIENSRANHDLLPQITQLHQKYLAICRGNL